MDDIPYHNREPVLIGFSFLKMYLSQWNLVRSSPRPLEHTT